MEERKLNFNAPLLSVRRSIGAKASSAGVKENRNENSNQLVRHHAVAARKLDPNLDQETEPVAVPFNWEKFPGRPKEVIKSEPRLHKESCAVQKHREKKAEQTYVRKHQLEAAEPFDGKMIATEFNNSKERVAVSGKKECKVTENYNDNVYSDAVETLTHADSCSMRCSDSGLSSSNGNVKKPPGTFATDPQTRDFMMSRFLPAAKAVALEPPKYCSRKQYFSGEQPRQVTRVISMDKRSLVSRQELGVITHCDKEVSESEFDFNGEPNPRIPNKAFRLLPRICFKNAISVINPVSGLKMRSPSPDVKRSLSQTIQKNFMESTLKRKPCRRPQSPRVIEVEKKLSCGSNRLIYATSRTSSPLKRSISPYRNATPTSPCGRSGFVGVPREAQVLEPTKGSSESQEVDPQARTINRIAVSRVGSVEKRCTRVGTPREELSGEIGKEKYLNVLLSRQSKALVCVNPGKEENTCPHDSDPPNLKPKPKPIISPQSPLPLLLPKRPSESWLWRTLPSTSMQEPRANLHRRTTLSTTQTPTCTTTWENIVKSSYLHHHHVGHPPCTHLHSISINSLSHTK